MQSVSITIHLFSYSCIYLGIVCGNPLTTITTTTERLSFIEGPDFPEDLEMNIGPPPPPERTLPTTTPTTTTSTTPAVTLGFDSIARLIARDAEDDYQEEFMQENKTKHEEYPEKKGKGPEADDDLNIEFRLAEDGDDMQPILNLDFSDVFNKTNRTTKMLPYYNRWDFRSGPQPEFDEDEDADSMSLWKSVTIPAAIGFLVLVVILLIVFRPRGYLCKIMVKNVKLDSKGQPIRGRR